MITALIFFVFLLGLYLGCRNSVRSFVEGNNVLLGIDILWSLVAVVFVGLLLIGRMGS